MYKKKHSNQTFVTVWVHWVLFFFSESVHMVVGFQIISPSRASFSHYTAVEGILRTLQIKALDLNFLKCLA